MSEAKISNSAIIQQLNEASKRSNQVKLGRRDPYLLVKDILEEMSKLDNISLDLSEIEDWIEDCGIQDPCGSYGLVWLKLRDLLRDLCKNLTMDASEIIVKSFQGKIPCAECGRLFESTLYGSLVCSKKCLE